MPMTDISVAPHKLMTFEFGAAACQASATTRGSASPEKSDRCSDGKESGLRRPIRAIWAASDGADDQIVISFSWMNLAGATEMFEGTTYNAAPADQVENMSYTETSKLMGLVPATRSSL